MNDYDDLYETALTIRAVALGTVLALLTLLVLLTILL